MVNIKMRFIPLTEGDKKMLKRGFSKKIYVVGFDHNNDLGYWVYKNKKFIFKINKNSRSSGIARL